MTPQTDSIEVPVDSLRRWSAHLFDHLDDLRPDGIVSLPMDYYWNLVPADGLYNPYETPAPKSLTLGQLSWDVENLDAMVSGDSPTLAYGLVWLSAILAAVGHESLG